MKLVIALGNPGDEYAHTWHNAGFMVADDFVNTYDNFSTWKLEKKFQAYVSIGTRHRQKVIVAKPQTYMNNSGQSASALAKFYKIKPADIIVIHDEIDIALGKLRISVNASAAGHNGIKSVIDHLGTKEYIRLRIGINPPIKHAETQKFVLQKIGKQFTIPVEQTLERATQALDAIIAEGPIITMNRFN